MARDFFPVFGEMNFLFPAGGAVLEAVPAGWGALVLVSARREDGAVLRAVLRAVPDEKAVLAPAGREGGVTMEAAPEAQGVLAAERGDLTNMSMNCRYRRAAAIETGKFDWT